MIGYWHKINESSITFCNFLSLLRHTCLIALYIGYMYTQNTRSWDPVTFPPAFHLLAPRYYGHCARS